MKAFVFKKLALSVTIVWLTAACTSEQETGFRMLALAIGTSHTLAELTILSWYGAHLRFRDVAFMATGYSVVAIAATEVFWFLWSLVASRLPGTFKKPPVRIVFCYTVIPAYAVVGIYSSLNCLAGMNDCRMIASTESPSNCFERMLCHSLAKMHGNLTGIYDGTFPALANEKIRVQVEVLGNDIADL